MRQRAAARTGALLAVALGTTLALSPTLALADAVAEKPAQAHEQQVSVLDLGAANTADPETPEGAANPQVPEPPVAPANPSNGQDPQPTDPQPVAPTWRQGWVFASDGSWYYLAPSGAMVTGWREVSERLYKFSSSGRMYEPQMTPVTDGQRRVADACRCVPSPDGGLCSEWSPRSLRPPATATCTPTPATTTGGTATRATSPTSRSA